VEHREGLNLSRKCAHGKKYGGVCTGLDDEDVCNKNKSGLTGLGGCLRYFGCGLMT
jgi:hypothetical protein